MKALEISNLDQHLKPVQIDGVSTGLELSTTDLRISTGELSIKNLTAETFSVDGDIDMNGSSTSINMSNGVAINSTHTAGDLTIYSKNIALLANAYDGDGDSSDNDATLILAAASGYDPAIRLFNQASLTWNIGSDSSDSDKFKLDQGAVTGGATKLTLDTSGNLTTAGDITSGDDIAVAATGKVNFDGILGTTFINEHSADLLRFVVGGAVMLDLNQESDVIDINVDNVRLADGLGTYSATGSSSLQTKAQIDAAISAGAGGGTSYWNQMVPGYKLNWANSSTYYTYYRNWYENWSNGDSSIGAISYTDSHSAFFIAPRAGTITNVKIQGTSGDTGFDDPFKFYFYKAAMASDATSFTLTAMFNTSSITPPTINRSWSHTEDFSSSNTFAEDDLLYVWMKKDSHSANQDVYFVINVNGEYS